uniref:Uncharacterized protein n=1 Tax=Siphoviridae sp. ct7aK2 TaxID=2825351 RepID=A0A8S5U9B6_9CAUD|nr:MAG TPA: hypothetical protein [Siphoviridae sp. ct7aK2]
MKKTVLILSFLFLLLLNMQVKIEDEDILSPKETTYICNNIKHPLQDELRNYDLNQTHNTVFCLTTRSLVISTRCERPFKVTTRLLELSLQKEQNILNKISETYLITQSINFSSLRMRSGHWIYVLRKIII